MISTRKFEDAICLCFCHAGCPLAANRLDRAKIVEAALPPQLASGMCISQAGRQADRCHSDQRLFLFARLLNSSLYVRFFVAPFIFLSAFSGNFASLHPFLPLSSLECDR
jgi:hypothetical protein